MGIIDDYFDGYYSEEMIESQVFLHSCLSGLSISTLLKGSMVMKLRKNYDCCRWVEGGTFLLIGCFVFQVDQLVFEELVRERFPKLGLYIVGLSSLQFSEFFICTKLVE